jgi:hypothetical protein
VGGGIAHDGKVTARVTDLMLQRAPEGRILEQLLAGDVVDEITPVPMSDPVVIALFEDATATTWGQIYVGRGTLVLAPLNTAQRAAREQAYGVRAVDGRDTTSLRDLRSERAGTWTWELRNVLIDRIEVRPTTVISLDP